MGWVRLRRFGKFSFALRLGRGESGRNRREKRGKEGISCVWMIEEKKMTYLIMLF